ncbi:MAG: sulfatase-like hydrolase/transferase [Planctomycetes bacterium]|nr:sulfatase-like hydrolase/transferase [Planctomycetota bacterium]
MTLLLFALPIARLDAADWPNIVVILADDLGYGDLHCMNLEHGKIATPRADKLASEGMIFTDAHSGSSVCTPTRYGLLTGRYSWRSSLQSGVVTGYAPCLIDKDRPTIASFLKSQGYHTAIIGKWHLNFEYLDAKTGKPLKAGDYKEPPIGATIPDGPITHGFEYYLGFHHARDIKAVIENDRVIEHDDAINMLPRLAKAAVSYVEARAKEKEPFFLYLPLNSPHTPIVPSKEWQGRSGLGAYGDYVMQTDDVVGQVLDAIGRAGIADNTLVVFTSDNGCSPAAGIPQLEKQGHYPNGDLRGTKADIWDGGHRVPFLIRWPGHIAPGSTSDQTVCLTDIFATVAQIIGQPLPANGAEDSVSFLPALSAQPIVSTRAGIIHHSISGHFAYRLGDWKLELARGSGGWSKPTEKQVPKDAPKAQLYNMKDDLGEQHNLYNDMPEIVTRLLKQLESDIKRGRSTNGPAAKNDIQRIDLWKSSNASTNEE